MATRKQEKNKNFLTGLLIFLIVLGLTFAAERIAENNASDAPEINNSGITVHFIDVGQGDCEFIELPEGECMLIDAGEAANGSKIVRMINSLGYTKIDYLIATHPHSDHIGGLEEIVKSFDIGSLYMPRASSNSRTFESLLSTIKVKGLKINTVKAGVSFETSGGANCIFLSPAADSYDNLNNYSAVLRLSYYKDSYLFTGDAEALAEKEMLKGFEDELDCDVLKVGHHGSSSSSGKAFINAVSPSYAVISCGKNNSYGHPDGETLKTLKNIKAEVYRTDLLGTVTVKSSGGGVYEVSYEVDS